MVSKIDRRTFLGSGALLVAGASIGGLGLARRRGEDVQVNPLLRGYDTLCSDLDLAWWDRGSNTSNGRPGIRSTDGSGGWNTGRPNFNRGPASVENARGETFWQEAQYFRFLCNDHDIRSSGSLSNETTARSSKERLLAQRTLWHSIYTPQELAGDGSGDGTVNASDDAAWKLQALKKIHEVTNNRSDLATLRAATIAMLSHYLDRFTASHRQTLGDVTFSAFGCLYARPGQDPNGQGRATTYEVGIMDAALYLAGLSPTENAAFRTYAATVYGNFQAKLQRPSGIYFQTLQLDPSGHSDATPFLKPIDAAKALPRQDFVGVTIGGTMGMAVIASELFRQTGDERYHRDVAHIVSGIAAEYLQNGCILCDRDPWTAGVWAYDFARRALSLPDVDPGGKVAAALAATSTRIVSTRTPIDTYLDRPTYGYSAEWSGNTERSIQESRTGASDGVAITWQAAGARANGGKGGGAASPNQIMTSTSSGIMLQAAVHMISSSKA